MPLLPASAASLASQKLGLASGREEAASGGGGRAAPNGERTKTGLGCPSHETVAGVGLRLGIVWGADGWHDESTSPRPPELCSFLPSHPSGARDVVPPEGWPLGRAGSGATPQSIKPRHLSYPRVSERYGEQKKGPSPPTAQAIARRASVFVFAVPPPSPAPGDEE